MESQRRKFNKTVKRMGIFIGCYFVVALIVCTLLILYTDIPQWLNGLIIVLLAAVFYLIFILVCAKIDKKKEEKRKEILDKRDPFSS